MPLAESILELTKFMSSEDAKKTFENLLTKEPTFEKELREHILRQADYDRNSNKWKTDVEKANNDAQEWKDWAKDNVPIHEELVRSYTDLEKQSKELQTQLAAAQAARSATGDDTVNAAELEARVKDEVGKLGFASKTEIDRIINEQAAKLAKEEVARELATANKKFFEETVPAMTNFTMDAAEIAMQWMREFPDQGPIDRAKFSEFMKERSILEPKKAYDEYVKPQRDKLALDAEVAKQVKAKEQELMQQFSASGMPGGGATPPGLQSKGAVQMRIDREAEAAAANGNLAISVAKNQAVAELRAEGKF